MLRVLAPELVAFDPEAERQAIELLADLLLAAARERSAALSEGPALIEPEQGKEG